MAAVYLILASTLAVGQTADPAQVSPRLTLRQAERAIDRALVTELAGDYQGGRRALRALLAADAQPEEVSARARLTAWLVSMRVRQEAFARLGRTARGYAQAFSTLKDFGSKRAQLFWDRSVRDLPEIRFRVTQSPAVHVRFERLRKVDAESVLEGLRHRLTEAGFGVVVGEGGRAPYELRVNLDAGQVEKRLARVRVTAEGSFLLRQRMKDKDLVASYARRRTVTRRREDAARAFAVRRAVDDLAWAAIFRLRASIISSLRG